MGCNADGWVMVRYDGKATYGEQSGDDGKRLNAWISCAGRGRGYGWLLCDCDRPLKKCPRLSPKSTIRAPRRPHDSVLLFCLVWRVEMVGSTAP